MDCSTSHATPQAGAEQLRRFQTVIAAAVGSPALAATVNFEIGLRHHRVIIIMTPIIMPRPDQPDSEMQPRLRSDDPALISFVFRALLVGTVNGFQSDRISGSRTRPTRP